MDSIVWADAIISIPEQVVVRFHSNFLNLKGVNMANNPLKILRLSVDSFGKIDRSQPVMIVFPDGVRHVQLEGDQAVGKTSVLSALKAACGYDLPENAVNKTDNDRRAEFEFEKNDRRYKVKITKTRFEVELLVDNNWTKLSSPKGVLADILGPVGASPMFLKDLDGKKQVEWLRSFYRLSEDEKAMETRINNDYSEAYKSRTQVKKDHARLEQELKSNSYYLNRESWQTKIDQMGTDNQAKDLITDVQARFTEYTKAKSGVDALKANMNAAHQAVTDADAEIEELQRKLAAAQQKKEEKLSAVQVLQSRIAQGEKWIEENKAIEEEHANITSIVQQQTENERHKIEFTNMVEKEKQERHLYDEYLRLEGKIDELKNAKKKFIQAITPDLPDLEVCVPDDDEKREGIFYQGKTMAELSESELWSLYAQLLEKLNLKIIIIENIGSLGSGAVEIINQYIAAGGYVFASQMIRVEKNLKVQVLDKVFE
jgi:hypothetical protein